MNIENLYNQAKQLKKNKERFNNVRRRPYYKYVKEHDALDKKYYIHLGNIIKNYIPYKFHPDDSEITTNYQNLLGSLNGTTQQLINLNNKIKNNIKKASSDIQASDFEIDNLQKKQILNNFDLIDKSLENLLLDLSYNINQELFMANLIKKMISKDSFDYLLGRSYMIKHPYPFVINFELNLNRPSLTGNNFPSIIFFNISTVELEFKNLYLSIQRNKINELKNQFQRLIKKETFWRQKEITLNKIR